MDSMLTKIDLRSQQLSVSQLRAKLPRAKAAAADVLVTTAALVNEVKTGGLDAVKRQISKFDGVDIDSVKVPQPDIDAAISALDPDLRVAIETSIERVRLASQAQLPTETETAYGSGQVVSQRWVPVSSVGLYVPGGKAVYPSSVVMNVVPAQVAGVRSIAIASPAQRNIGAVHPTVLATAGLLGVESVYAMGGAGAIAALAYGLEEIGLDPVDMITGPGNAYVAAAKAMLRDTVGIDAVAGPTEIMVLADSTANPAYVAADLLSQTEHDELAGSVLVTDDPQLVAQVEDELAQQLSATPNKQRAGVALSAEQSAVILVDDLEQGLDVVNAYAPEHLEVQTSNARAVAERVTNAGAIFVGDYSPVSLGDYMAGSNHVLPTSGQARFAAALSTETFLRSQQLIQYDAPGLSSVARHIDTFASAEHLWAHGRAVMIREEGE